MFKFIVPVCLTLALISPSISNGQNCGCEDCDTGCTKTRKKLALIEHSIEIKHLRRVCETDECGCSRTRLAFVSEPHTFKCLGLVDVPVDPCKPNFFEKLKQHMSCLGGKCGGCDRGCESCEDGYDQGQFGDEFIESDYVSDGDSMSYESASPEEYYVEPSPQNIRPRETDPMPRNVQPRNIVPRETTPRNNPSVIESRMEPEGYNR